MAGYSFTEKSPRLMVIFLILFLGMGVSILTALREVIRLLPARLQVIHREETGPVIRFVIRRFARNSIKLPYQEELKHNPLAWKLCSNRTPIACAESPLTPDIVSSCMCTSSTYLTMWRVPECIRTDCTEPTTAGLPTAFLELLLGYPGASWRLAKARV
jgi:hypothetical protein